MQSSAPAKMLRRVKLSVFISVWRANGIRIAAAMKKK